MSVEELPGAGLVTRDPLGAQDLQSNPRRTLSPSLQPAVSQPPHASPDRNNPHYAAIGGVQVIERLVDRFYYHMDTLPAAAVIRAMHPKQLGPVKAILVSYLTEWTGGPHTYSEQRGHPRLRHRHSPFSIGDTERDAWMTCMRAALVDVVPDVSLRAELDAAFYRIADSLRNGPQLVQILDARSGGGAGHATLAGRAKSAQ